jgi:putative sterol carrier protein
MELFVSEDMGVREYFEEFVPKMFAEQIAKAPVSGMEGTVFTIEFDINDGSNQIYGITVKDAKEIQIAEGAPENPMVKIELSEDVWRKAVTGKMAGAVDMFTDMGQMADRRRYDTLASTRGTMKLQLSMPDGSVASIKVVMNGADSPAITFSASVEDWAEIATGKVTGPAAFMSGKLKMEGDLAFAMALGNMMS